MSKSLVSAFHIKPNNNLVLNDYDIFQDKELLENLKDKAQSMGINTREKKKKKQQLEALLQQLGVR